MKQTRFVPNFLNHIRPPKGWGIVYHDYLRDGIVYAIVPLNLIIRWFRKLGYWLKSPKKITLEERKSLWLSMVLGEINRYKIDHDLAVIESKADKLLVILVCMQLEERIKKGFGK